MKIEDMAISRSDGINKCIPLGRNFIEHFDEIYHEKNAQVVNHWCNEMQGWYDDVSSIKLKPHGKPILNGDLRDWFFTAGANAEDYMTNPDYDEEKAYDDFVTDLIITKDVKKSIQKVLNITIKDSLNKGDNKMDYTKYIFEHFNASIRNSQLFRAIKTILNDMDNANYFDVKYDYHEIYRNLERIVSETFDDTPSYKWDLMKFYQDAENANYEEAYDWFIEDLCDVVNDITEEDYR